MVKGTYPVSEPSNISKRDASFKSCLCALLIFIAICVVILLVGVKWGRDSANSDKYKDDAGDGTVAKLDKEEDKERFISSEFFTTTPSIIYRPSTTFIPKTAETLKTTITPRWLLPKKETTRTVTENDLDDYYEDIDDVDRRSEEREKDVVVDKNKALYQLPTTTTRFKNLSTVGHGDDISDTTTESTASKANLINRLSSKTTKVAEETTTTPIFFGINASTTTVFQNVSNTTDSGEETSNEETTTTNNPTTIAVSPSVSFASTQNLLTTTTESFPPKLVVLTKHSTMSSPSTGATTIKQPEEVGQTSGDDVIYPDNESGETIIIKSQENSTATASSTTESIGNSTATPLLFVKLEQPVCDTPKCKSEASRMLSLMDYSIDPCEDFYEFSCGGMQADNDDSGIWSAISEQIYLINDSSPSYLKKFRSFYDSCVSHEYQFNYEERLSRVLSLVKEVGGMIDGESAKNISSSITDLFIKLILRQSLPIMDVDVDIDADTSRFVIKLTLPKKTSILKETGRWSALSEGQKRCLDEQRDELHKANLNLTKIHESYLECQKDHTVYLNSIETAVQSLGFYSHLKDKFNQTQRIQDLRTTIEWDILTHLNELPEPDEVRKSILSMNYTARKVSDLLSDYSFLEWDKLFKELTGHNIENHTVVQVYFPEYFKNLFRELSRVESWKINNALIAIYAGNLYENLLIPQAKYNRKSYCVQLSAKLFNDISSNIYMNTWTNQAVEESQKFVMKLFNRLKDALGSSVLKAEWLDDDSRTSILSKLRNKINLTFYKKGDVYNNATYLNLKYHNVELNSSEFSENAIKMMEASRRMFYSLHGKPYSVNSLWSFFFRAYDKHPGSIYTKGLIMAPLGMTTKPFNETPKYITLARIGLPLAKEIARHFDTIGIHIGMSLTSDSLLSYQDFRDIMEDEFLLTGTRVVNHQIIHFNAPSKLSAPERISDNTAFRMISDISEEFHDNALLPWMSSSYSREKVFFIAAVQEYCQRTDIVEYMEQLHESEILPPSLRIENIMSNSKIFSNLFECPEGSRMNNNPESYQFPYLFGQYDNDT